MDKKPFIGQLNRIISIVEKTIVKGDLGGEKTTNLTVASPYALMKDISGNEDIEGKIIHAVNRSYTIRVNAAVKAKGTKLSIIDGGKQFEIYHIKEIGKTHLELLCTHYE